MKKIQSDSLIHLNVPAATKGRWIRASRSEGKKLSEWIVDIVEQHMEPTPEQIKKSRLNAGLTQAQAAAVIYKKLLAWQRYESGDRSMDCALYELFMLKTGQMELPKT